jgi:hypothetical protein
MEYGARVGCEFLNLSFPFFCLYVHIPKATLDYYWKAQLCRDAERHMTTVMVAAARDVAETVVIALVAQGARFVRSFRTPSPNVTETSNVKANTPQDKAIGGRDEMSYAALNHGETVQAVTLLIEQLASRQAQRRLAAGLRESDVLTTMDSETYATRTMKTITATRVGNRMIQALFRLHMDKYCLDSTSPVQKLNICASILDALQSSGRRLVAPQRKSR